MMFMFVQVCLYECLGFLSVPRFSNRAGISSLNRIGSSNLSWVVEWTDDRPQTKSDRAWRHYQITKVEGGSQSVASRNLHG
jgi:hypothetical protein